MSAVTTSTAEGRQQQSFPKVPKKSILQAVENAVSHLVESIDRSKDEDGSSYSSRHKESFTKDLNDFKGVFEAYLKQRGQVIDWNLIKPPPQGMIIPYGDLGAAPTAADLSTHLNKLVVLKLNGGLGTTMGCVGPKSAIEVHSRYTFLDLTVQQIEARPSFA